MIGVCPACGGAVFQAGALFVCRECSASWESLSDMERVQKTLRASARAKACAELVAAGYAAGIEAAAAEVACPDECPHWRYEGPQTGCDRGGDCAEALADRIRALKDAT